MFSYTRGSANGILKYSLFAAIAFAAVALANGPTVNAQEPGRQGNGCAVPDHFGRMFNLRPAAWSNDAVNALSSKVMAEEEDDPTPEGQVDDEENKDIDAGMTYVGQFIDHDLSLDPRPDDLTTPTNPTSLQNFRTAAFDLDSVYGAGPKSSPDLYQTDHVHLKLGAPLTGATADPGAVDLPRDGSGQALLGDPRNDENRLVASLHSIFLRFHNRLADRNARDHRDWSVDRLFTETQHQVRMYYQYAVLTDFLPTIVGRNAFSQMLPSTDARRSGPSIGGYNPCTTGMPVEFSVAAYRFGHSMVRPIYRINTAVADRLPVFTLTNDRTKDLAGFSPSPPNFGVDWSFLLPLSGTRAVGKPQASYKLDNSLVFPLSQLPLGDAGSGPTSLAQRNILRSIQLGLPSGQDVARAIGVTPLRDDQILIGKASGEAEDTESIVSVDPSFAGKAPLWTYILAESTASAYKVRDGHIEGGQVNPMRLGPVGARIVGSTFIGLMAADHGSVLYESGFKPSAALAKNGQFGFRELILAATSPDTSADKTPTAGRGTSTPKPTGSTTPAPTGSKTPAPSTSGTPRAGGSSTPKSSPTATPRRTGPQTSTSTPTNGRGSPTTSPARSPTSTPTRR